MRQIGGNEKHEYDIKGEFIDSEPVRCKLEKEFNELANTLNDFSENFFFQKYKQILTKVEFERDSDLDNFDMFFIQNLKLRLLTEAEANNVKRILNLEKLVNML